jgi:hypothetical protein
MRHPCYTTPSDRGWPTPLCVADVICGVGWSRSGSSAAPGAGLLQRRPFWPSASHFAAVVRRGWLSLFRLKSLLKPQSQLSLIRTLRHLQHVSSQLRETVSNEASDHKAHHTSPVSQDPTPPAQNASAHISIPERLTPPPLIRAVPSIVEGAINSQPVEHADHPSIATTHRIARNPQSSGSVDG